MAAAGERLGKHVPAATDTHATREELLEIRSVPRYYNRDGFEQRVQCSAESRAVKRRLGGWCELPTNLGVSQLKVRL
jgi:hypothetical protein